MIWQILMKILGESQMKSYRIELLIKLLGKRWRME